MGLTNTVIGGEYLVLGKIGEGSFGEVFRATHIATGMDYAIKREPINVSHPQLDHEAKMYEILKGGDGIARVHWFGQEGMYNAMVIDLLGPTLKQVRRENEKLPLSFVIELGVQIISQLEFIHKKGIIYRDIKPENFLLDADIILPEAPSGKANTPPTYPDQIMSFFNDTRRRQHSIESNMSTSPGSPVLANYGRLHLSIVDFGLATFYRDSTGKHIPNRGSTRHKVGTARYASINIHSGREHTRRDDIESVGYMLIEFLIGTLPWSGISARNSRQGWAKMKEIKEDIDLDELCEGLPKGFMTYIGYARSLKFDEEPDYGYLCNILRSCAGRGLEAQTVRCHREPIHAPSRSLEQCFDGLQIHRGHDPFKNKDRPKKDNPLQDWRDRAQYVPAPKDERQEYNPNAMWTTTPPDLIAKDNHFSSAPYDVNQDMKDRIEWEVIPGSIHDHDKDRSSSVWTEENLDTRSQPSGRNRKASWGDNDLLAQWGEDDKDTSHSDDESLPPFVIGSFQDEATLTQGGRKMSNGRTVVSRQNAPQDARFYANELPLARQQRPVQGSGGIQANPGQRNHPNHSKNRRHHHHHHISTATLHPLSKDSGPPTLSPSFSSLGVRAGAVQEPGIERSQVAANRGYLTEMCGPEKAAFRTGPSPLEKSHAHGERQDSNWGSGRRHGNNNGRSGSETWQNHDGRHDRWRPGRHHGSLDSPTFTPDHQSYSSHHARQASVPGNQTQSQQPAQTVKPSNAPSYPSQGQSQMQGRYDQSRSQGPGYGDQRRRTRSRKCSNASLSSLTDHRNGGGYKLGNGSGTVGRVKPK
ncbi:hypothetical protein BG011_006756 [Mortierella polycephala]|uniref:non-specific serine/threonine protein kinase n=1 Tax=Mortierella polycephala TaxID=41804 RepID=A0A9P6QHL2_9FUNG|nr:hypothetical protein BG011_006756 [Mortierella polycephala]